MAWWLQLKFWIYIFGVMILQMEQKTKFWKIGPAPLTSFFCMQILIKLLISWDDKNVSLIMEKKITCFKVKHKWLVSFKEISSIPKIRGNSYSTLKNFPKLWRWCKNLTGISLQTYSNTDTIKHKKDPMTRLAMSDLNNWSPLTHTVKKCRKNKGLPHVAMVQVLVPN